MTLTAVFDSFEDMVCFAESLTAGNKGAGGTQAFLKGGNVNRPSKNKRPEPAQEEPVKDEQEEAATEEQETEAVGEQPAGDLEYTLVQVREKLAELQKAGKRAQVQELINGFGVKRLTEIPEDRYAELMQKAGEL